MTELERNLIAENAKRRLATHTATDRIAKTDQTIESTIIPNVLMDTL
jgi:hypothetical protein